jgi:tRNA nucleotidyltransferase (CCA-adding enzyme)
MPQPLARSLMSSPVRTIRPDATIAAAQSLLLRYGHSGLAVVDEQGQLVGVISRRDLEIALHHGFGDASVSGHMATELKTIAPDTPLSEIEAMLITHDIGRLPVLDQGRLVGIVTRTDVLRQRVREQLAAVAIDRSRNLQSRLLPAIQQVLTEAAQQAEQRGWQLYLVGGAVRDLLLAKPDEALVMADIDLVVDGHEETGEVPVAVATLAASAKQLAQALQQIYPGSRVQVHGQFQTAAILWHRDPVLDSLAIDIATARTEFYPYPAANPEVEASSIRQDLYRRDFTINALALRLTEPQGEILDFFGGLRDLDAQRIRVLHPNSLIEDPTRIYRAVRFAVRLGFELEAQTEGYIRYAIDSGVYQRYQTEKTPALQTRLKQEIKYILQTLYWKAAVRKLSDLGALSCIHPDLQLTDRLEWRLRMGDRWLKILDPAFPRWELLLEILLSSLEPEPRRQTAERLQLAEESVERLKKLEEWERAIVPPPNASPSQIVHLLSPYNLPTLVLLATPQSRFMRRQIWQYLSQWRHLKPPIDGNDLKALGYLPGRQYKQILDALLSARLDGQILTRADAEAFLSQHFPLEEIST